MEQSMRKMELRDMAICFSEIVEAIERGEPTTIIRDGRPFAVVVPAEDAMSVDPEDRPSFADFLLSFPGPLDTERDTTALRSAERYFAERSKRVNPGAARAILARAGVGDPPEPGDEIEPGAS